MLLRKFISRRLSEYYAQPSSSVVGSVTAAAVTKSAGDPNCNPPINFSRLLFGSWQWHRLYADLYEAQQGQWLTPVELFRPYYSHALAEFVVRAAGKDNSRRSKGLHVVELGGGRGTNAAHILSHLREVHPAIYDHINYTIFDASPTLLELQKQVVLQEHNHSEDKIQFVLQDMTDVAEGRGDDFLPPSDVPTVVIAMELLDNLAHDKVTRCRRTRKLLQAEVVIDEADDIPEDERDDTDNDMSNEERYREEFHPLTDPLLRDVLEAAPSYARGTGRRPKWVPTVACGVIRRLYEARPNASLVFADFDWLPPPELIDGRSIVERRSAEADGEPIITDMADVDHACYLTAPRLCDILYPTDFAKLGDYVARTAAAASANVRVETMKQADFLVKYGPEQVDQTRSWTGYTPMLDDFSNYSVAVACNDTPMNADENRLRRKPITIKR
jgi:SAM-dependent MidA family methyltransferase